MENGEKENGETLILPWLIVRITDNADERMALIILTEPIVHLCHLRHL